MKNSFFVSKALQVKFTESLLVRLLLYLTSCACLLESELNSISIDNAIHSSFLSHY